MINVYSAQKEIKKAQQVLKEAKQAAFEALPKPKQARALSYKKLAKSNALMFVPATYLWMSIPADTKDDIADTPEKVNQILMKITQLYDFYDVPFMEWIPIGMLVHAIAAYALWKLETKDKTEEVLEAEAHLEAVKLAHAF